MSQNIFGRSFRIMTFGEDQGPATGVVIDGMPPRVPLDLDRIQAQVGRYQPLSVGDGATSPPEQVSLLSGVMEGRTTGAPLCLMIANPSQTAGEMDSLRDVFRPGHGDLTWFMKYGIRDWRGGGRASGRENLARLAAGAVAMQVLSPMGVKIVGNAQEIGGVQALSYEGPEIGQNPLGCADPDRVEAMMEAIDLARRDGDSVGGVIEVRASGVPAGWGDPVFGKLDALLAAALVSISGVRGIEIGDGFRLTRMRGSEANDPITPDGFDSNHAGGILGGISTGEPLIVRVAIKPAPSIRKPQFTVDNWGNPTVVAIGGQGEVCVVPQLIPICEAMVALVLVDTFLIHQGLCPMKNA